MKNIEKYDVLVDMIDKARDILDGNRMDNKGFTKTDLERAIILVCNERGIEYKGQWL